MSCLDTNGDGKLSQSEIQPNLVTTRCAGFITLQAQAEISGGNFSTEPSACDPSITKADCLTSPAGCAEKADVHDSVTFLQMAVKKDDTRLDHEANATLNGMMKMMMDARDAKDVNKK